MLKFVRSSWLPVVLLALGVPSALAKERQQVTISYVIAPPRPLPEGLKAVAVIDAGVESQGTGDGREQKWSKMAADMIEAMLANSSAQFGSGLDVAQRRHTRQVLAEQDLKLAGLVQGADATRVGKLLAVQGLITSRITINIDTRRSTKSTVDWGSVLGMASQALMNRNENRSPRAVVVAPAPAPRPAYRVPPASRVRIDPRTGRPVQAAPRSAYVVRDPRDARLQRYRYSAPDRRYPAAAPGAVVVAPAPAAPPPQLGLGTKEVEEISRHLTVQCSFSLIDATTGRALAQYSPPPYQKTDTSSPDFLFGSLQDPADLDPVDHFIGELVERATQEFVSMLVPTQVEYTYTVTGLHSRGEDAVRALRADDYERAFDLFLALHQKEKDEHETVFALGVVSELLGRPEQALGFYREAVAMKGLDDEELRIYTQAKNRLTEHLPRIVRVESER